MSKTCVGGTFPLLFPSWDKSILGREWGALQQSAAQWAEKRAASRYACVQLLKPKPFQYNWCTITAFFFPLQCVRHLWFSVGPPATLGCCCICEAVLAGRIFLLLISDLGAALRPHMRFVGCPLKFLYSHSMPSNNELFSLVISKLTTWRASVCGAR